MNTLEASQQISRYAMSDLSSNSMEFLAFESNYNAVIYDISGVLDKEKNEVIVWPCEACQKNFTTKQSLERHKDRFPLCKVWENGNEATLSESVYIWAQNKIDASLGDEKNYKKCRFCKIEFSSVGNFHKHFKSSVVCNKLGVREIKKAFQ